MSQTSRPWAGTTIGDAGPYTAPQWWDVWGAMMGSSGALVGAGNAGIIHKVTGRLAVTVVGANFLSVAAGAAFIDGLYYRNDAAYSVTVTSATAGQVRDDRLVVRKYFSGLVQTARLVLLPGSEAASPGPGTPPALTQDTTRQTYWDLPLARVSITDGGVITLTDEREFLFPNEAVVRLEETVIGAGGATVTWSSIPQVFRHLKILWQARSSEAVASFEPLLAQFNGDTGNNYLDHQAFAQQPPAGMNPVTLYWDAAPAEALRVGHLHTEFAMGVPWFAGQGEIIIPNYSASTPFYKHCTYTSTMRGNSDILYEAGGGYWTSLNPVTSIKLYSDSTAGANPEFTEGSVFSLYGLP